MNILQLCCFTDLWHSRHNVVSIDKRTGLDVLDLSDNIGKEFDLIVAAPPCDQFTLAAAWCWKSSPDYFISLAKKCFSICIKSGASWLFENPPGRIEKFLPELTSYRIVTWQSSTTNKQYILYSNFMLIIGHNERYGQDNKRFGNMSKKQREAWEPELINDVEKCL